MKNTDLPYQDKNNPIESRIDDLISRMTIEEKIGQLCMFHRETDPDFLKKYHCGTFINVHGDETLKFQKEYGDGHRLQIPILFSLDCIRGHALYPGATIFPTQLALSCSWNPDLLREVAEVTAREMTSTGILWTFSPVLDLARDMRWGRIGETFGEDGYLAGKLGAAMIRGYQGDSLSDADSVLACAKHFAAYCETTGGRDSCDTTLSERHLRRDIFPPFQEAVDAGCATFMAGYQSLDGVPCSANHWLLSEVLRDEMGFDGFVVSDWNNLKNFLSLQMISDDPSHAAKLAVEAGNDMSMITEDFPEGLLRALRSGSIDEKLVDRACRRILNMKFRLGLFDEKRYANLSAAKSIVGSPEHYKAAVEAAYQSMVLLENRNGTLPLPPDRKGQRICVVGENATKIMNLMGDWSFGDGIPERWQDDPVVIQNMESRGNLFEGIRNRAGENISVVYRKGCGILDSDSDDRDIEDAVAAAEESDIVVTVVGDSRWNSGEYRDRADIGLTGRQQELLERLKLTGKPLIVVLVSSKPLSIPWVSEQADALICLFNQGDGCGEALGGLLFGDRNFTGKLSVSFPHHVGQQPVRYNLEPGWHTYIDRYVDLPSGSERALYPFGYGLSYTSFSYSDLRVKNEQLKEGEDLELTVSIANTGTVMGTEIVQLYIRDCIASVTRPDVQLKGFARVDLSPGETKEISFTVPYRDLAVMDSHKRWTVEPGSFELMIARDSRKESLEECLGGFTVI